MPVAVIRLSNASIVVELDPEHGAEILSIRRPGEPNILATYDWATPLWARRSTSYGDQELDWLSEYRGGWQELFPNAGAACTVDGVPLPFHGEASATSWQVLAQAADHVTLTTPARLPLVLERRMRLARDRATLFIEETIRSDAPVDTVFLLGHHPAFVATEGARIDLPSGTSVSIDADYRTGLVDLEPGARGTWPVVPGRDGGRVHLDTIGAGPVQRLAYLSQLGAEPWAAIRGVTPGEGVAMAWDSATFPCAWFWWEIGGSGYPWHGRARIVAIEPNTSFPSDGLAAARERGEAHELAAGAEHQAWLTVSLFEADERAVRRVGRDGSVER